MSVKDIRSHLGTIRCGNAVVGDENPGYATTIIDTAEFELGFMAVANITAYTTGTLKIAMEESDDAAMAGANVVPDEKLIGNGTQGVASTDGDTLLAAGVFSNKRYLRIGVVGDGGTATATANMLAVQKSEYQPTS